MNEPRIIATVDDYIGLIAAFRARVNELGISYAIVDVLAGWTPSYASKLLCEDPPEPRNGKPKRTTQRGIGPLAFDALLRATAVRLAVIDDVEAAEGVKNHPYFVPRRAAMPIKDAHSYVVLRKTRESMRQMSMKAAVGRKKISPKKRSRLARKAARARWRKPRITEITPAKSAERRAADTSTAGARASAAQPTRPKQSAAPGAPSRRARAR